MSQSSTNQAKQIWISLLSDPAWEDLRDWQFSAEQEIRIGRSEKQCEIKLLDERVSRLHATLVHTGTDWLIKCVGNNGTFQNGRRVSELVISNGTVLEFVKTGPRLHFRTVDPRHNDIDNESHHTVTRWVTDLGDGNLDAATDLWEQYFPQVLALARSRMAARHRRASDEEDVAASVFESLCMGMAAGKFSEVRDRESLWKLLCVMTRRKVSRHMKHELREKRGGGKVAGESVFGTLVDGQLQAGGLDQLKGNEVAGDFCVMLVEETERLFHLLGDGELRHIAELRLTGHTNDEIAAQLGCHERTVKRRLQTIRSILETE